MVFKQFNNILYHWWIFVVAVYTHAGQEFVLAVDF